MASVSNNEGEFSVTAYAGDAQSVLAFNLDTNPLLTFALRHRRAPWAGWYREPPR